MKEGRGGGVELFHFVSSICASFYDVLRRIFFLSISDNIG